VHDDGQAERLPLSATDSPIDRVVVETDVGKLPAAGHASLSSRKIVEGIRVLAKRTSRHLVSVILLRLV
jgi:hypothetical protein